MIVTPLDFAVFFHRFDIDMPERLDFCAQIVLHRLTAGPVSGFHNGSVVFLNKLFRGGVGHFIIVPQTRGQFVGLRTE